MSNSSKSYRVREAIMVDLFLADIGLGSDATRTAIGEAATFSEKVAAANEDGDIIIERQNDVMSELAVNISKAANGTCLVISPGSGSLTNPTSKTMIWEVSFILKLYLLPIRHPDGTVPEEEIHEAMLARLHHQRYVTAETGAVHPLSDKFARIEMRGWDNESDPEYLRRDTSAVSKVTILSTSS